jgi:Flp pilus assembly protein TadG
MADEHHRKRIVAVIAARTPEAEGAAAEGAARRDGGAVTVEFAIALPAVTLLLGVLLALGVAVVTQVRCTEAARAGAREAALGSSEQAIAAVVRRVGGGGAHVSVVREGGTVTVTVTVEVHLGGLGGERRISASAHASCEQSRGCG